MLLYIQHMIGPDTGFLQIGSNDQDLKIYLIMDSHSARNSAEVLSLYGQSGSVSICLRFTGLIVCTIKPASLQLLQISPPELGYAIDKIVIGGKAAHHLTWVEQCQMSWRCAQCLLTRRPEVERPDDPYHSAIARYFDRLNHLHVRHLFRSASKQGYFHFKATII
jgi:hypothetical protein